MPKEADALHFVIYSRSYCHLCDDMRDALIAALGDIPAGVEMVDVDADAALVEQYDELVPVLLASRNGAPAVRLCHYHLDAQRLATFLAGGDSGA
ncbi:glutaredoxin family protein [Herbaspirillum sp.]|uniref:glutaredoxin family protein n=1 Tax=Herbaspirillum sp. TaxID=1890675 RepID=UPI001B131B25|nr:glutaredoxin family protein [Herbaspirillum sp.]MBO9535935.1 glutaredoxin family protein [Herbaspirillum sp.]